MTGKKNIDLSAIEEQLFNDFDRLVCAYDKLEKKDGRSSFLNSHYILYQLLKRHKFPCDENMFINILKTKDRIDYHNDITQEMFEILEWNFTVL